MKQTSIEWLFERFQNGDMYDVEDAHRIKHQAAKMHKEEIVEAWYDGAQSDPLPTGKNAERYYDRVYGNE